MRSLPKYLGLHFHKSGDIVHLTGPIKHKAPVGQLFSGVTLCCNVVALSTLICNYTGACLTLWLQGLGHAQFRCRLSQTGLFWTCRTFMILSQSGLWLVFLYTRRMLLTEIGFLCPQVFWWRQTLRFRNNIAALPVGSFFHTVLLDSLNDAFHHGAFDFTSSVAACLHRVGVSMPRDTDRVPMLDISAVNDALKAVLRGLGASTVFCPRQAPNLWQSQYVLTCGCPGRE